MTNSILIMIASMATFVHAQQGGQSATQAAAEAAAAESHQYYENLQIYYANYMLIAMAAFVGLLFVWKMALRLTSYLRCLYGIGNEQQRFFVYDNYFMAWFKRHIVAAPLFRTRHNREFQLSKAVNMGTLPSRFQALCLAGLIAMNVTVCVLQVPFSEGLQAAGDVLKNRTGTMATVNLIPLVILVARNNPLIPLLGLSFDTWNFFHRWLARIVTVEGIVHLLSWMIPKAQKSGWAAVAEGLRTDNMDMTGLVTLVGFVSLVITASSPLRHAFYETFLHLHILLVCMALIGLWYHLQGCPQENYLIGVLVLWPLERVVRFGINVYRNISGKRTMAKVEALSGDASRVTLKLARPWTARPGQHVYICIPSIGLWTYHPFSVAWDDKEEDLSDEKGLVKTQQDVIYAQKNETVSLLIRRRTGFTDSLFKRAAKSADGQVYLPAFVEGPYGGIHNLDSYGTVLLFAGGVGITHHIPFVRHLVQGHADGVVAARRVTLVWTIQSPEHLEWVHPWMTSILQINRRREVLRVMLFITRPRSAKEIRSPSATVEMFPGRPNIQSIVDKEMEHQIGAMGVMVCGQGSLSDDVRRACRQRQAIRNIDFIEESFTW